MEDQKRTERRDLFDTSHSKIFQNADFNKFELLNIFKKPKMEFSFKNTSNQRNSLLKNDKLSNRSPNSIESPIDLQGSDYSNKCDIANKEIRDVGKTSSQIKQSNTEIGENSYHKTLQSPKYIAGTKLDLTSKPEIAISCPVLGETKSILSDADKLAEQNIDNRINMISCSESLELKRKNISGRESNSTKKDPTNANPNGIKCPDSSVGITMDNYSNACASWSESEDWGKIHRVLEPAIPVHCFANEVSTIKGESYSHLEGETVINLEESETSKPTDISGKTESRNEDNCPKIEVKLLAEKPPISDTIAKFLDAKIYETPKLDIGSENSDKKLPICSARTIRSGTTETPSIIAPSTDGQSLDDEASCQIKPQLNYQYISGVKDSSETIDELKTLEDENNLRQSRVMNAPRNSESIDEDRADLDHFDEQKYAIDENKERPKGDINEHFGGKQEEGNQSLDNAEKLVETVEEIEIKITEYARDTEESISLVNQESKMETIKEFLDHPDCPNDEIRSKTGFECTSDNISIEKEERGRELGRESCDAQGKAIHSPDEPNNESKEVMVSQLVEKMIRNTIYLVHMHQDLTVVGRGSKSLKIDCHLEDPDELNVTNKGITDKKDVGLKSAINNPMNTINNEGLDESSSKKSETRNECVENTNVVCYELETGSAINEGDEQCLKESEAIDVELQHVDLLQDKGDPEFPSGVRKSTEFQIESPREVQKIITNKSTTKNEKYRMKTGNFTTKASITTRKIIENERGRIEEMQQQLIEEIQQSREEERPVIMFSEVLADLLNRNSGFLQPVINPSQSRVSSNQTNARRRVGLSKNSKVKSIHFKSGLPSSLEREE
ncbi:MAG: hypothetical protein MHMPM18_000192 [Marteilia pararefringens]